MNSEVPYSLFFVLCIHAICFLGAQSRAVNAIENAEDSSPDMSVAFVPPISSNPNAPRPQPPVGTPVIYAFPAGGSGGVATPSGYPSSRGFGNPGIFGTPVLYSPPISFGGSDGNFGYFPQGGSFGYLPQAGSGVYAPPSVVRVPAGYGTIGTIPGAYSSSTGSATASPNYDSLLWSRNPQRYGMAAIPLYSQVTPRVIARST